ncbi:MAG: OsmC family protein [Candidatus Dormibacteria bacterium]|jgi:uncharacterized OsmC-like protein
MTATASTSRRLRVDHERVDRFRITVRQHTLWVDQPVLDGGEDGAATPTELFVASLASCVAFYVRRFLARHGLPVAGLSVIADYDMAAQPARVGEVRLQVQLAGDLPPERRAALLAVAARCTVHNTVQHGLPVRIALAAPVSDRA